MGSVQRGFAAVLVPALQGNGFQVWAVSGVLEYSLTVHLQLNNHCSSCCAGAARAADAPCGAHAATPEGLPGSYLCHEE